MKRCGFAKAKAAFPRRKAVLGVGWFAVSYILRFYLNVFIEPQFNPLKHFPVVTVSAKILFHLGNRSSPPRGALRTVVGERAALAIGGANLLGLPGMFGFFVWELKENWRMYQRRAARTLRPALVGHHGETLTGSSSAASFPARFPNASRSCDGQCEKATRRP